MTIDAVGTQKKISGTIIDNDGDYVLSLKKNHGTLYNDTELFLDCMEDMKKEGYPFAKMKAE